MRTCMYGTFHIQNQVRDHWFDPREGLWCVFTVKKRTSTQLFDLHGRVRMQIFSYTTCPIMSYVWASTDMFPRSVSTTRRVHARVHTLKDRCLLTFWVTKSFLCVTLNIWHHVGHQIFHKQVETMYLTWLNLLNLQTILSMQFFTYKVMSENSGLTHAKNCDACSLWKDVPRRNFLTYMEVSACKFSHERTCLYTTCPIMSYVWASTGMFPRSVSTTRRVHARVHTLEDRCLLTFWLTKSFLCVALNIWHHVGRQIFHKQVETMYNRMT